MFPDLRRKGRVVESKGVYVCLNNSSSTGTPHKAGSIGAILAGRKEIYRSLVGTGQAMDLDRQA
ncbi:hypothetical protein ASZ90_015149 [hydrocarbon metagenome]|uniref:Uncharacterized protein n=1 Tax=hydrocarbon metagenome TaxID=938273 RepID=A0A0W8F2W1_9ZZZZ